jgi:Arc/MetJ-type ribon-helix-helix transcriptional regulator
MTQSMQVTLSPEQELWLRSQVAQGTFASLTDALQQMIAERMEVESSDLTWAKPYVDAAREAVTRGDVITGEAAALDIDEQLASFGR